MPILLCGWCLGEVFAIREVLSGRGVPFLYLWLAGWTFGGGFAAANWLWMIVGREQVKLDSTKLGIRREIGGIGHTRSFDTSEIRNLRCLPAAYRYYRNSFTSPGKIAFDYGAKTYRFGVGIDEAEANDLIRQLKEHLPSA